MTSPSQITSPVNSPNLHKIWIILCVIYPVVILISIAATNLLLPLLIVGWFIYRSQIDLKPARILIILTVLYLAWTLVAVAFSPYESKWFAWLEERSTLLALIPGLVVGSSRAWTHRSLKFVSYFLVFISLYAIFQYFFGYDLVRGGTIKGHLGHFRAIGFQNSPLTFAGMIAMIAPIVIPVYISVLWRAGLLTVTGASAVIASMSRSIVLGSLGWSAILLIFGSKKTRITGLVLFLSLLILPKTIFTSSADRLEQTDETRFYLWRSALNIISEYRVMGIGENNWNEAFAEYGAEYDKYKTTAHAHSDFLTATVENGIVGALLLLVLWVYIIIRLFSSAMKSKGDRRDLKLGFLSAFLIILFGGLFQNYQTDAENALLLWFVVGMSIQICGWVSSDQAEVQ